MVEIVLTSRLLGTSSLLIVFNFTSNTSQKLKPLSMSMKFPILLIKRYFERKRRGLGVRPARKTIINYIFWTTVEGTCSLIRLSAPATVLELICSRSPLWLQLLPLTVCGPGDLCDCDGATARGPSPSAPLILPAYPTGDHFVFIALSVYRCLGINWVSPVQRVKWLQ